MAKKFSFPKYLQRTKAETAEEVKVQKLRQASFGRAHQTAEERLVSRGALIEQTARGNLDALGKDLRAGWQGAMLDKYLKDNQAQLAFGLAMQGRYDEAEKHHPDPLMKKRFKDIAAAIKKPDTEKCDCPDTIATVDGVEIAITPRFSKQEIFSQKHGKVVSLITCSKCGHVNAREPKSRLLQSQAWMAQNRAAQAGRGRVRDSEILKIDTPS